MDKVYHSPFACEVANYLCEKTTILILQSININWLIDVCSFFKERTVANYFSTSEKRNGRAEKTIPPNTSLLWSSSRPISQTGRTPCFSKVGGVELKKYRVESALYGSHE